MLVHVCMPTCVCGFSYIWGFNLYFYSDCNSFIDVGNKKLHDEQLFLCLLPKQSHDHHDHDHPDPHYHHHSHHLEKYGLEGERYKTNRKGKKLGEAVKGIIEEGIVCS